MKAHTNTKFTQALELQKAQREGQARYYEALERTVRNSNQYDKSVFWDYSLNNLRVIKQSVIRRPIFMNTSNNVIQLRQKEG